MAMNVRVYPLVDYPEKALRLYPRGKVYFWLYDLLGEAAANKIFLDIFNYYLTLEVSTLNHNTLPRVIELPRAWITADNLDDVCVWRKSPQGRDFWLVIAKYFAKQQPFTEWDIERLTNLVNHSPTITGKNLLVPNEWI